MRRWMLATGTLAVVLVVTALIVVAPAEARRGGPGAGNVVVTTDQAMTTTQSYLDGIGLGNLEVGTTIAFANHTWVAIIDPATGDGALELIVDHNGDVHPQRTPMWNTTYRTVLGGHEPIGTAAMSGMMGGAEHSKMHGTMPEDITAMMNGVEHHQMNGDHNQDRLRTMDPVSCGQAAAQPTQGTLATPLTADAARTVAQTWLDANQAGAIANTVYSFPGYFTFEVTIDGQLDGLLSVRALTGTVMPQGWHRTVRATS